MNTNATIGGTPVDDFTHLRTILWRQYLVQHPAISITFVVCVIFFFLFFFCPSKGNTAVNAPYVGSSWSWLARIRFLTEATETVSSGYHKFTDRIFKVSGNDMLIVPAKYVEELRQLPDAFLDAIEANTDNFQGVYSATSILNEGVLHNFVLQTKLTPKLSVLVPIIREELEYAMKCEFPRCDDEWKSEEAFGLIIRIISRLTSRLFVGPEVCRDEHWLRTTRGYTERVFRAIIFLRLFPLWLKPLIAAFDVNSWRKRVKWEIRANMGPDRDPEKLTRRTLVLTLASSHTTSIAACQALFELYDRPKYVPILRAEAERAMIEDGGWRKTTLSKLRMLDSFLRESQRMHPPSLLGFKRNVKKGFQLSDRQHIPAGVHMLLPIVDHAMDNPRVSDPHNFDGLR